MTLNVIFICGRGGLGLKHAYNGSVCMILVTEDGTTHSQKSPIVISQGNQDLSVGTLQEQFRSGTTSEAPYAIGSTMPKKKKKSQL